MYESAAPADELACNVMRGASRKVRGFVLFHDSASKATTPLAAGQAIGGLLGMAFSYGAISPLNIARAVRLSGFILTTIMERGNTL